MLSRREFLATSALAPLSLSAAENIPVGLELFSVRDDLARDLPGTLGAVARMGYTVVTNVAVYSS